MFGLTQEQLLLIAGALFAISEVLALIPSVKSNSIFQLIFSLLKKALGKS
ncbi:hypothetical protein M1146_07735 [Patescibacteria group bacterium]|nr:hypothetical protein [Patescibacteria group bacterium]